MRRSDCCRCSPPLVAVVDVDGDEVAGARRCR